MSLGCYKTAILDRIAAIGSPLLRLLLSAIAGLVVGIASGGGLAMSELVHI
jgi:hypothetical protein